MNSFPWNSSKQAYKRATAARPTNPIATFILAAPSSEEEESSSTVETASELEDNSELENNSELEAIEDDIIVEELLAKLLEFI